MRVLCVFGTGPDRNSSTSYYDSGLWLAHTARVSGKFDKVFVFDSNDLLKLNGPLPDWWTPELLRTTRGYGWFSWQPFILRHVMKTLNESDILFYLDAACEIIGSFEPLFDKLKTEPYLFFEVGRSRREKHTIERWTKPECLEMMGLQENFELRKEYQVCGGFQGYRVCNDSRVFIDKLCELCGTRKLIDDSGNQSHRHNQSILSIMVAKYHITHHRDPSQFGEPDKQYFRQDQYPGLINLHRAKMERVSRIAVITPTIGPGLRECMQSIKASNVPIATHYIVIDGAEHESEVRKITDEFEGTYQFKVEVLRENTGKSGWNGHRIYASYIWKLNEPYVVFLDSDNTLERIALHYYVQKIVQPGLPWGFSFRTIVRQDGTEIGPDYCESLGLFEPSCLGDYLIDTNCYCMKTDLARQLSGAWNNRARPEIGREVDRELCYQLLKGYALGCVPIPDPLVRYRVGNRSDSVQESFFKSKQIYEPGVINRTSLVKEFGKPLLYVWHFGSRQTERMALKLQNLDFDPFEEWQYVLIDGLREYFDIRPAHSKIPRNSTVLFHLCIESEIDPVLLKRTDIRKIVYTAEGPNIRHSNQYRESYLANFHHVLTYYPDYLSRFPLKTEYIPFIYRVKPDWESEDPEKTGWMCMILENRPGMQEYQIDSKTWRQWDGTRFYSARGIKDLVVYGRGWNQSELDCKVGTQKTIGKETDLPNIQYIKNYKYNLIIENCNVPGYVSEKIYDSIICGTIPVYAGGNQGGIVPSDCYIDITDLINSCPLEELSSQIEERVRGSDYNKIRARMIECRPEILARVSPYGMYPRTILSCLWK